QTKTLQSAAVYNDERKEIAFFVLNLDQKQDQEISFVLDGFGKVELFDHQELSGYEPNAMNTFTQPDAVTPKTTPISAAEKESLTVKVPAMSFNLYRLKIEGEL
ncbi:MAG: hypothetical protein H9847_10300, partial [Candidatus Anaerobiospirillum pullicola]|nr:hypothetical protein [Candidatus Anaerobiospirillum pullicola]